mgnify:CR=1 FL=1
MTDHRVNWQEVAGLTFAPATDQLWRQTPTPFVARYQPWGVPLEFATNASVLAEMAADDLDETIDVSKQEMIWRKTFPTRRECVTRIENQQLVQERRAATPVSQDEQRLLFDFDLGNASPINRRLYYAE